MPAGIRATRMDGSQTELGPAALDALASRLRGALLAPGDPRYDAARAVWNAMIDRRPARIVQALGAADVVAAVSFAREHALLLSVRGGGHHIGGLGVCDGGLAIDLSAMRSVRVDPGAKRAHVDAGALLADVDHETQAFGLAAPLGINSTTGVGGLTLGGGFGWLSRKLGLTVDQLVAADVVTAEGRLVRASEREHPDLFWAIRGGGGNFGVVTRFELALHPIGPEVVAGLVVFPLAEGASVLARWRDLAVLLPEETAAWVVMRRAPPLPFLAPEVHGTPVVVIAICHTGDATGARRAIDAVRGLGTVLGEHVGPQPYVAWQRALDPLLAPGMRNYWKSHNFVAIDDEAIARILEGVAALPTPMCEVIVAAIAGAPNRRPREDTAYPSRDARYVLNVHGRWESPPDDATCIAWARGLFTALEPYASTGAYVNFMTGDETARVPAAYGGSWTRLRAIKHAWDPENLFRMNQNIPPSPVTDGATQSTPGGRGAHVLDR